MTEIPEPMVYCSFCGKHQGEVRVMLSAPTAQICDECVEFAREQVKDHLERKQTPSARADPLLR